MQNKNLNLALGLSILALNSDLLLIQGFVLLGLYLIYTYVNDNLDKSLNYKLIALGLISLLSMGLPFINNNLLVNNALVVVNVLKIVFTYLIYIALLPDLISLTISKDDQALYQRLHFRVIMITVLDILVISASIISILAVVTNVSIFFNIATALTKDSLVYALSYGPVILKYFISKPLRDVYTEIKNNEVIE